LTFNTVDSYIFRYVYLPYLQLATSEMWCWSGARGI